ncbi:tubulin polyglutamylase complex subunit 1-like [Heterodontus francisci]|uniref:tubulin polyglutamylase complex subunit 1-like n=1 Tax=Heterodontus francisci TaxID=7792 RepID=UPI00355B1810
MAAAAVSGLAAPLSGPPLPAGLTLTLREALLKVLENRPEDPICFLSEYFENLAAASEGAAEKPAPRQQQVTGWRDHPSPRPHPDPRHYPTDGTGRFTTLNTGVLGMKNTPGLPLLKFFQGPEWVFDKVPHNRLVSKVKAQGIKGQEKPEDEELVPRALKQLLLCHYSRPAFSRNLASAFQILSCPIGKKKKPGLKGRAYTELLRQICGGAHLSSCSLIQKLQCWDHEAVSFGVFRHGVLSCFIFLEFVKISGRLFDVVADSDEADRTVCQVLLDALKDAVSIGNSSSAIRYLDAGSKLAPNQLGQAMERAVRLRQNESIPSISKEEFTLLAAPLFIEKVKPIC